MATEEKRMPDELKPEASADFVADFREGEAMAREWIAGRGDLPDLLHVVRDMPRGGAMGGLEAGFLSTIDAAVVAIGGVKLALQIPQRRNCCCRGRYRRRRKRLLLTWMSFSGGGGSANWRPGFKSWVDETRRLGRIKVRSWRVSPERLKLADPVRNRRWSTQ
jgi:hypothetical protein